MYSSQWFRSRWFCTVACSFMLALSAAQQQVEVRTREWNAQRYRQVGEAIAGMQWHAYLYLLWHGTPLESRAAEIGADAGFVGLVIGDLRSNDARLVGMAPDDRAEIMRLLDVAVLRLRAHPLRSVTAILAAARLIGESP